MPGLNTYGGAGDETFHSWFFWTGATKGPVFISTDEGNDQVQLNAAEGEVDLGSGDDRLDPFSWASNGISDVAVATGSGQDRIEVQGTTTSLVVVTDFDVAFDRLQIANISRLRDFESWTNGPEGVSWSMAD